MSDLGIVAWLAQGGSAAGWEQMRAQHRERYERIALAVARAVAAECAQAIDDADCFVDDWRGMRRSAEVIRERFGLEGSTKGSA